MTKPPAEACLRIVSALVALAIAGLSPASATMSTTPNSSQAGVCAGQIVQLRRTAHLDQGFSNPTSHGQTYSQLMLAADLTRAEALDTLGKEEECLITLRHAQQEYQAC